MLRPLFGLERPVELPPALMTQESEADEDEGYDPEDLPLNEEEPADS